MAKTKVTVPLDVRVWIFNMLKDPMVLETVSPGFVRYLTPWSDTTLRDEASRLHGNIPVSINTVEKIRQEFHGSLNLPAPTITIPTPSDYTADDISKLFKLVEELTHRVTTLEAVIVP